MGLKYHVKKHVRKWYDGVNVSRWNLDVEPFVV
jgi:hypothetical protein